MRWQSTRVHGKLWQSAVLMWIETRVAMTREIEKLTSLRVAREDRPGRYADGDGLYLQISASRSISWVFRYRTGGHLSRKGKPLSRASRVQSLRRPSDFSGPIIEGSRSGMQ